MGKRDDFCFVVEKDDSIGDMCFGGALRNPSPENYICRNSLPRGHFGTAHLYDSYILPSFAIQVMYTVLATHPYR